MCVCVCVCVWSLHMSLARRGARPGPLGAYGGRGAASRPWSPRAYGTRNRRATGAQNTAAPPPCTASAPNRRHAAVPVPGAAGRGRRGPGRPPAPRARAARARVHRDAVE